MKRKNEIKPRHAILLALFAAIVFVILITALTGCRTQPVPVVIDGWNWHYEVPVDTMGIE